MATVMTEGLFGRRLWPGMYTFYMTDLKDIPKEYDKLFDVRKTDKRFEEMMNIVPLGLPSVKAEGDAMEFSLMKEGLLTRVDQVMYANGFAISHELVEDDQYAPKIAELGAKFLARSGLANKEIVCSNIFNNGFSSTGSNAVADGQAFFSASHNYGGVNFSNLSTAAALSEATYESMMQDVMNQVDDAGIKLPIMPKSIEVPVALKYTAARVLRMPVDQRTGTADRDISAIAHYGSDYGNGVAINTHRYFTSNTAFFIKTSEVDSTILFEREKLELSEDNDFVTFNRRVRLAERFAPVVNNVRGWQGNAGA